MTPGLAPAEIKKIIEDTAEKVGNAGEERLRPSQAFFGTSLWVMGA